MPTVGGAKSYARHTRLGALMYHRGLRAVEVARDADVNPRLLSDYTSGRRAPSAQSRVKLTAYFGVDAAELFEDRYPWTADMAHAAELDRQAKAMA